MEMFVLACRDIMVKLVGQLLNQIDKGGVVGNELVQAIHLLPLLLQRLLYALHCFLCFFHRNHRRKRGHRPLQSWFSHAVRRVTVTIVCFEFSKKAETGPESGELWHRRRLKREVSGKTLSYFFFLQADHPSNRFQTLLLAKCKHLLY